MPACDVSAAFFIITSRNFLVHWHMAFGDRDGLAHSRRDFAAFLAHSFLLQFEHHEVIEIRTPRNSPLQYVTLSWTI